MMVEQLASLHHRWLEAVKHPLCPEYCTTAAAVLESNSTITRSFVQLRNYVSLTALSIAFNMGGVMVCTSLWVVWCCSAPRAWPNACLRCTDTSDVTGRFAERLSRPPLSFSLGSARDPRSISCRSAVELSSSQ